MTKPQSKNAIILDRNSLTGGKCLVRMRVGRRSLIVCSEKDHADAREFDDERKAQEAADGLAEATGFPIEKT